MFRLFPERRSGSVALFLRTLLLLQQAASVVAKQGYICFHEIGEHLDPKYGLNMLNVHSDIDMATQVISGGYGNVPVTATWEDNEFTLTANNKRYWTNPCASDYFERFADNGMISWYGKNADNTYQCEYAYFNWVFSKTPDPVLNSVIKQNCEALLEDASNYQNLIIGISVPSIALLLCVAGRCYLERKREHIRNILLAEDSESQRDAHDQRWQDLENSIAELRDEDGVDSLDVLSRDVHNDYLKYVCPIGRALMNNPLKLPCGHNFEAVNIHEWLQTNHHDKCPCCHQKISLENAKPNQELKDEIEARFKYFATEEQRQLNSIFHTPATSLRSSRSSASFYSLPASDDEQRGQVLSYGTKTGHS